MTSDPFRSAIAFAADLIRIPSPPGGEERVARRVVEELRRLGFDDARTDDVGNAVGVIRGRGEAPPLMLSCHLDVVDVGDPEAWEHDPYGGAIDGGALHGRGAMDIKGPLALQTHAAASLIRDRPAGDLIVAHTVWEERGGWGMAHLLERLDPHPGAVVIGEATGGDVCIGHRGRAEVEVEIRGRAGHASMPDRALNALHGVPAVLRALERLPDAHLVEEHPQLGRSTLAATGIEVSPASRNVIPDRAVVAVDWRVLPGLTAEAGLELIRAHLREDAALPEGLSLSVRYARESQRSWTGQRVEWEMFGPGFLLRPDHPLVRAAAGAVERMTGRPPRVRPWRFATDGRHSCGDRGIPTLGYAPGDETLAHTNRERLDLAEAERAFSAYPDLIRSLFDELRVSPGSAA